MRIFIYECVSAGALGPATANSLRREGWAMLSAVVEDFQRLPGIRTVTLIDGPNTLGDECVPCRDERTQFRELARQCDYTLVIAPESDDWLLKRSLDVLEVGGRLLGSTPEAIRLTADKFATAECWHAAGVPHPETRRLDAIDGVPFAPPSVIKPRHGAGSQATFLVRDAEAVGHCRDAARREWSGDLIVQPYVPGLAASVALLIGAGQTLALLPARQHLSEDGRFHYLGGSLPLPEGLAQRAIGLARRAVAPIPGLLGYVGVDLVLGQSDGAIEINPRLTTSYIGLRRLCQDNLAELLLQAVRGDPMNTPRWTADEVCFTPFRPCTGR